MLFKSLLRCFPLSKSKSNLTTVLSGNSKIKFDMASLSTLSVDETSCFCEAEKFVEFVNDSPSPFHAVHNVKKTLLKNGFKELSEKNSWDDSLKPNGRYYFTRNGSTIVAFAIGGKYQPGNGINLIGAHTDSPVLKVRLKPVSLKKGSGYLKVGVQTYGGGLWHTWFDRDLSVAGVVMVESEGRFTQTLVRIDEPILRIPNLAIHLDRNINDGFKFNNETQLVPILATVEKAISETEDVKVGEEASSDASLNHHPILLRKIAKTLKIQVSQIRDFELCLYDTQPSTIGGICKEFIFSPRLDNLNSSYCAIEALVRSTKSSDSLSSEDRIWMAALFDNEEIGSRSAYGADSSLLDNTIRRLQSNGSHTSFEQTVANSFLVSADMAHAIHPNYPEKHEEDHAPAINKGMVIKINANQRYATTSVTSTMFKTIAKNHGLPIQVFVVRNDVPCGSTIGPLISSNLGIRTIDVGNPMLSMHSIRETMGTDDVSSAINIFKAFYTDFSELDSKFKVD
ncbi:Aspartyl aminopeptidase [Smittium mucronatum]|uniref:aspartyl aminopeptidase n=1 Tax=Smittium mucronatum TaxID=133383 RepID=A0A1R0H9C7_9FUNG|nr:Aspartyl aminopeptidase [Smittium mucronatum]